MSHKPNFEEDNECLKLASKNWWSRHSQDYVNPGEIDHLGIREKISDKDLLILLNKIDKNFMLDAYFAQEPGQNLFSNFFSKDLAGKQVLEVGCGLGAHTEAFCRLGAKVTSIDIAPMSVNITQRRLKMKNLQAEVMEADAENLPFENDRFDFVWSWGVIHHSPNTYKCAKEMTRVLKTKGTLGVMLYNKNSCYNLFNVIFRYGILQGKMLFLSTQELRNRYTDGKANNGAPLSKYYSAKEVKYKLFNKIKIQKQISFEQKRAFSWFVPPKIRRKIEKIIPDKIYSKMWSKFGFLLYTEGIKP